MASLKGAEKLQERVRKYAMTWYNKVRSKRVDKIRDKTSHDIYERIPGLSKILILN